MQHIPIWFVKRKPFTIPLKCIKKFIEEISLELCVYGMYLAAGLIQRGPTSMAIFIDSEYFIRGTRFFLHSLYCVLICKATLLYFFEGIVFLTNIFKQ